MTPACWTAATTSPVTAPAIRAVKKIWRNTAERSVTGEGERVPYVVSRVVDGHRARKPGAVDEKRAEQDGQHGRQNRGHCAGRRLGGGCDHVGHGQLRGDRMV